MMRKAVIIYTILFLSGAAYAETALSEEAGGLVYDSKGRRDPFIPLIARSIKVATGLEGVQSIDDIILEGIVWDSGGDSIAIMNGMIVKEGDEIGSVKIEIIQKNNVELYINRLKHKIALGEEGDESEKE